MITPFIDLSGRNPQVELQQNLRAIIEQNNSTASIIEGITGMTIASFGPINMDLTITHNLTVPHGLGYTPIFLVYYYNSVLNQYVPLPMIDFGSGFVPLQSRAPATVLSAWVDNQNLYIDWHGSAGATQQQFFYFICRGQVGS